jgi:hypothetical protein
LAMPPLPTPIPYAPVPASNRHGGGEDVG